MDCNGLQWSAGGSMAVHACPSKFCADQPRSNYPNAILSTSSLSHISSIPGMASTCSMMQY
jgi:hypothetical protein